MTIQIGLIGLGQIGASIGMALSSHTDIVRRVGYDRDGDTGRQAEKLGAVERLVNNLATAVRDSDLVILSLPIDQIKESMAVIALNLKQGGVVMDTGPAKETVSAWASELLQPGRYYIGLTPVINPAYLHSIDQGIAGARADLFKGGLIAIVAPPRASSEAVKLAADLTRILGASALFVDPVEIDGLIASTSLLPQMVAAALVNAVTEQPGWREGRKVAGRTFAEATAPITQLGDPKSIRTSLLLNRDNMLRLVDSYIAVLQAMRADLEVRDEDSLDSRLERAYNNREHWWQERQAAEYSEGDAMPYVDVPHTDIFSRLIGGGRKTKPKK